MSAGIMTQPEPRQELSWNFHEHLRCYNNEGGVYMQACIIYTGTGPILVLTTFPSPSDQAFIDKLATKGIKKFIARELPLESVKEKYGEHFEAVMNDVKQTDDLRVLDYNGHNVFYNFPFNIMGEPFRYEP
jgi:hypothetical protein